LPPCADWVQPISVARVPNPLTMNLLDMYIANAADRGSDPAVTFALPPHGGLTLSWNDLVDRAGALADELDGAGVGAGTRVATVLVDDPNALPALLAMWRLDAIPVLIDPEWGESIRNGVLSHSRADSILTIGDRLSVEPVGERAFGDRPPLPPNTAMVAYTSGSTAAPKGIPLRHDRLVAAFHSSAGKVSGFRGSPPARVGSSMRLSGFGVLALHYLWSAAFGAEVVVLPRLELTTARSYWTELDRYRIDQTVLVPPLFELLLRASKPAEHECRPLFVNASGPISATTHSRFMERFGAPVLNCYGLTETTFACMVGDTDERGTTTQAVGRPDLVKLRLRREDGSEVVGTGEGEIEVRGPTVSDGYYDNDEANAALFDGPWLKTGDLGRRDETGKYWIVGRLKDAVMKGGSTVYLTEVEEACVALEGVLEAVAVRADLPGGIEDLGVIVRPVDGVAADGSELKTALDKALGASRSPRRVVVTDRALPRIGQNKIDRRSAQALWSELTTRS
jgi:acyl-CoA synthetase (AMP-forming)/AMP-acid ligase II